MCNNKKEGKKVEKKKTKGTALTLSIKVLNVLYMYVFTKAKFVGKKKFVFQRAERRAGGDGFPEPQKLAVNLYALPT